jgi:hypothetical protein
MAVGGDEEARERLVLARVVRERHRLGRGGALVEQRGVREIEAGEIGDHRLVVEQRFEPALADLGLVGRVLRVPTRVLEDVAHEHGRAHAIGVAHADERAEHAVPRRERADLGQRVALALRRADLQRTLELDRGGHRGVGERVERAMAEHAQHRVDLVRIGPDVSIGEALLRERLAGRHGFSGLPGSCRRSSGHRLHVA